VRAAGDDAYAHAGLEWLAAGALGITYDHGDAGADTHAVAAHRPGGR